jgi:hypothetical protein
MPRTSNSFERLRRSGSPAQVFEQKYQTDNAVAKGAIGTALTLPRAPSSCGAPPRGACGFADVDTADLTTGAVRFRAKISRSGRLILDR